MKVRPFTERSKSQVLKFFQLQTSGTVTPDYRDLLKEFPQEVDDLAHGFHTRCYRRFTNVRVERKHTDASVDECQTERDAASGQPSTSNRRRLSWPESSPVLLPNDTCIICDRKQRKSMAAPNVKNL